MKTKRLEAFSDGVLAIIITIMVLELEIPKEDSLDGLKALLPTFIAYILSFIYLGVYWNNHHHLFQAANTLNGKILWANLHLLFWLSLFPFATGYMGQNHFQTLPTALYGCVLFMASIAWFILVRTLRSYHTSDTELHKSYHNQNKGYLSIALNGIAIVVSFFQPIFAAVIYILVAILWFVPKKEVEEEPAR